MTNSEYRWTRFLDPLAVALDFAFGCHHSNLSRVFTLEGRSYKVCFDCGRKFDYSLRDMAMSRRRESHPAPRVLRTRHT